MEINYFDLVCVIIILLLGLKGIINGFFKEAFGLIGIIGGIFVASRVGDSAGEYLNNLIFNFESPSAISFMGFLATLVVFWLMMISVGYIFKRLSSLSGLGIFDRILGFVFGASKFFLIAAVIAHAAYSIKAVKSSIDSLIGTSVVFPIMVQTGSFIMKIDPVNLSSDINETISKSSELIKEKTEELIDNSVIEKIDEIKQKLKEN